MFARFTRRSYALLCFLLLATLFALPPQLKAQPATPQATPGNRIYLPSVQAPGSPTQQGPSSDELIALDELLGKIDAETGLLYRVYAMFGDSRLPAKYRGNDNGRDGTSTMQRLRQTFGQLSPARQALLKPFLLPPAAPGSALASTQASGETNAAPITWATVDARVANARIWWQTRFPEDASRAQTIANELDRLIWPKLTRLMRAPLADCGAACPMGGNSPRVDFYIAPIKRAFVSAFEVKPNTPTATYCVLERDSNFFVVAHELMHMIQYAYPANSWSEYDWAMEATATWAMHYVYPTSNMDPDYPRTNEEHPQAGHVFEHPELPLETTNDAHEYGAYLLYLHQDNPGLVKKLWERSGMANSLENLNGLLPGGFAKSFPEFAIANWNTDPIAPYNNDQLYSGAIPTLEADFGYEGSQEYEIEVGHLAAQYYMFKFDDGLRFVSFDNPLAAGGSPTGRLWALLTIDGEPQIPQDWTNFSHKQFCRDMPGENVESAVLIYTNVEWADRSKVLQPGPGNVFTDIACRGGGVRGTITWKYESNFDGQAGSYHRAKRSMTIQVKLRYDAENREYVDDGSTYSFNGTFYEESHDVTGTALGYIRQWTESGSGPLNTEDSDIIGWRGTGDDMMIAVHALSRKVGSTKYLPSGITYPIDGEEIVDPGCDDSRGMLGKAVPGSKGKTFDMACRYELKTPTTNGFLQVSGTLKVVD